MEVTLGTTLEATNCRLGDFVPGYEATTCVGAPLRIRAQHWFKIGR
jgi:hypothetical protein